jgi:hypothetical protein
MIINKIELVGDLPCFCISTDTGKYETWQNILKNYLHCIIF